MDPANFTAPHDTQQSQINNFALSMNLFKP